MSINKVSCPYSQLYVIDSFKQKVVEKPIESCSEFLKQNSYSSNSDLEELDKELWQRSQQDKDSFESLLCLRCRVSSPIQSQVNHLFSKFRNQYELDLLSMMVCVLDDTGETFLRVHKNNLNGSTQYITRTFNWENLSSIPKNQIRPFSAKVIYSFNPSISKIDTWTSYQVKSNAELKSYFLFHGLRLQTPWSLIGDSSPYRVQEAWKRCGRGAIGLKEVEILHKSYLLKYKEAKLLYKRKTGKISGWVPDQEFLQSLNPKQQNLNNLNAIDKAIRAYLAGSNLTNNSLIELEEIESQEQNHINAENRDFRNEQIALIQQNLKNSALEILTLVINKDRIKWEKDPSRKLAWQLYSEGLGQRDIAKRCEHKQGWVSKLFQEKLLTENIVQEATVKLVKLSTFQSLRKDPKGIIRMIEALKVYLICKQQGEEVSLLRQVINEVLIK